MKLLTLVGVALLLFHGSSANQHSIGWHGIIPLQSSRQDVERLFGKPKISNDVYQIDGQHVYIMYSPGPCVDGQHGGWKAAAGIVLEVVVKAKDLTSYEDLPLDKTGFEPHQDAERRDIIDYANEDLGIIVTVNGKWVSSITYRPTRHEYNLKCK